LNPTSGTVGAVQLQIGPAAFQTEGRVWNLTAGRSWMAGVVWWGRLTLKEGRSHSELDGPVGAGRVANGAGIQALRVELLDLNGNWAPEKKLEAAVHSSRVKLRGSKTITAKFQTRPTRRWTATFETRPVRFRICPPAALKKNPRGPVGFPTPTKERCGPV
jgi:hypothetical protein